MLQHDAACNGDILRLQLKLANRFLSVSAPPRAETLRVLHDLVPKLELGYESAALRRPGHAEA